MPAMLSVLPNVQHQVQRPDAHGFNVRKRPLFCCRARDVVPAAGCGVMARWWTTMPHRQQRSLLQVADQVPGQQRPGFRKVAAQLWRDEGLRGFTRGIAAAHAQCCAVGQLHDYLLRVPQTHMCQKLGRCTCVGCCLQRCNGPSKVGWAIPGLFLCEVTPVTSAVLLLGRTPGDVGTRAYAVAATSIACDSRRMQSILCKDP